MRVTGSAISRESRVGPVLGHDERAAVGGVVAVLGRVVAGVEESGRRPARPAGTETGSSRSRAGGRRGPSDRRAAMSTRATIRAGVKSGHGGSFRGRPRAREGPGVDRRSRRRRAPARSRAGPRPRRWSKLRQPLEPARQVPVPLSEQLHRRGQEHGADDRRVDQDRRRKPDAELLEEQHRERREDREDEDHHDRRARDDAGGRPDPVGDRFVDAAPRGRNASRIRLRMNTW